MAGGRGVRVFVDAWDPSYGSGMATGEDGPGEESSTKVKLDIEAEAAAWAPIAPPADTPAPDVVLLVDGVRRIDARVSVEEDDGTVYTGIAASYAAGVVRCDLGRGRAEVTEATVERGIFTSSTATEGISAGNIHYPVRHVSVTDPSKLSLEVLRPLSALEAAMGTAARGKERQLLVLDGPLRGRSGLPHAMGYIKTHHKLYLEAEQAAVVRQLEPGQRCPVFQLGPGWPTYTWYLRLPGPSGSPWAGVVRVEVSADVSREEVVRLADLSASTLPRFASLAYKDPRAPQNLTAIGGLEKRLHRMLGDQRLLVRTLITGFASA